jgi:Mn-dependent DtxR family transcriptional regulator
VADDRPDRALVAAIREELAAIEPARACDRRAEAIGLGRRRSAREGALARLALRLARADAVGEGVVPGTADPDAFDWATAPDHCRLAWLRGRFLAAGSLSVARGRTHLEFVVGPGEAPLLAARLAELGLPARWRLRRGRGVVLWKRRETVTTFLRRIGASASILELEARAVSQALRGDLNRVLNADAANLARSVEAAGRQLEAIEALEAEGRLGRCPPLLRAVAAARRAAPEASLRELAEELGLHRSAVQRALDRLVRLAEAGSAGGAGPVGPDRESRPGRSPMTDGPAAAPGPLA